MCSHAQIKKVQIKLEELGLPALSKKREAELRRKSFREVSAYIDVLQLRVDATGSMKNRIPAEGVATNRQLRLLFRLRDQARNPIKGDERIIMMAASVEVVQMAIQAAQQELQNYNDSHGVPIPQWRFLRGLYDDDLLHRNGISGIAKSRTPLTIDQLRALQTVLAKKPSKI